MHEFFCGPTSFALHRIPPQAKQVLPAFPYIETSLDRRRLSLHEPESYWPSLPLHILSADKAGKTRAMGIREHVLTAEIPPGSFQTDDTLGLTFASPQLTLLTMAPLVSIYQLAMATYELCGLFAIFDPGPELQEQIDIANAQRLVWPGGWRQVHSKDGVAANLWIRDPLPTIPELERYCAQTKGVRGNVKLVKALRMVNGVCASPLEVQASMLLGLPPRLGGEGLGPFDNNHAIALTPAARTLAGQNTCYADLYFEGTSDRAPIVVECQGRVVHDSPEQGGVDANRTLALQEMGMDVILLTKEQLAEQVRFDTLVGHLRRKLGVRKRAKSKTALREATALREHLFGDWETYYLPQRDLEHRNRLRTKRHKAQKKGQGSSKDSKPQQIML